ncbi:fatty acid desaturase [bacterium]|nr:fatty acid desaturase [bacterium]
MNEKKHKVLHVRNLHLLLFPLVEVWSFCACLQASSWWEKGLWLGIAALALNFGVHVTFHELVHLSGSRESGWIKVLSDLVTVCCGIPFDGYRWHHYTHHRFNNGPEDYSCTWKSQADGVAVPHNCWAYAFAWPSQLMKGRADLIRQLKMSEAPRWIQQRIQRQKMLLTILYLSLLLWNWPTAIWYFALTYWGWFLVTLHNYGQHLPLRKAGAYATSYQSRWYNWVFCNNGIHYEHHADPGIIWYELKPSLEAPCPVGFPHLAGPLFDLHQGVEA